MASRRYAGSDYSDAYERPRDRDHRPRRVDDRYYEEDIEYRRRLPSRDPPRERERETIVREREEVRRRSPPEFLREDYGRASAGPIVLSRRDKEEFEFVPRPRRRSPSPPSPERKVQSEEIVIRGNEGRRREPSPSREREEIIIRRGEREPERRPPPRRDDFAEEVIIRDDRRDDRRYRDDFEREDIVFRNGGRRSGTELDIERDDVISRRGGDRFDRGPPRRFDDDEIIIARRNEREREQRYERPPPPPAVDEYALTRTVSHERHRSTSRAHGNDSDEIIIRRDEQSRDRRGGREREEIVIRQDRSPSSESHAPTMLEPPERVIRAPDIHQNVITHHRHVYHDDMEIVRSRPHTPPPAPAPPPPASAPPAREDDFIEIHRHGERNGKAYDEDIIINRESASAPELPPPARRPVHEELGPPEPYRYEPPPRRYAPDLREEREIREEAEYYNQRALERSYPGEAYNGAVRDWAIVDVPPGTRRVRMDGAGGGSQEVTWQRYNGVRRAKFIPDGMSDEGYGSEIARPGPLPGGEGRRYHGVKDPTEGLWTEITKDLVVKEALEEAGYEFEETDDFYYVIAYLKYDDVARLVGLSEDIRAARRRRIKEMDWERRALPPPEERRETLLIEEGPPRPASRLWDREDEIIREREVVIRPGRPYR